MQAAGVAGIRTCRRTEVERCQFSSSSAEESVVADSAASLLLNQLEDTNHRGSHESSQDKLVDFLRVQQMLRGDCNVTTSGWICSCREIRTIPWAASPFRLCLPFPLQNAALPKCHERV